MGVPVEASASAGETCLLLPEAKDPPLSWWYRSQECMEKRQPTHHEGVGKGLVKSMILGDTV